MLSFQITNLPVSDYGAGQRDHLWVIVGAGNYFHGGAAVYFGPDGDIDADDLTSKPYRYVIGRLAKMGLRVRAEEIRKGLLQYRSGHQGPSKLRRAA
jgi:hypothetical protein